MTLFRIFDPKASDEARQIRNFVALDRHPELILYEGYCEKDSHRVHLERQPSPQHKETESKPALD